MTSDVLSAIAKFPFVMVMTAHFFRGSVFLIFNIPLLSRIFIEIDPNAAAPKNLLELIEQNIIQFWKASIGVFGNILIVPAVLFLSVILGLLITPVERLIACIITKALEKIISCYKEATLFHGTEAMSNEYSEQLSWFLSNADKKLHWEWELFHYYVYWGLFLNIFLFCIAAIFLLWAHLVWYKIGIYFIVIVFFASFAIARSSVMGKVHLFYGKEYKKNGA